VFTNFIGKASKDLRQNSPFPTDEILLASIKLLRREIVNGLRMRGKVIFISTFPVRYDQAKRIRTIRPATISALWARSLP